MAVSVWGDEKRKLAGRRTQTEKKVTGTGEQRGQTGGWRGWGVGEKVFPQTTAVFGKKPPFKTRGWGGRRGRKSEENP